MRAGFVPVRAALVRAVPELADVFTPSLIDYFSHDFYASAAKAPGARLAAGARVRAT